MNDNNSEYLERVEMEIVKNRDLTPILPQTSTDRVMRDTFWVGVYPGMTGEKIEFIIQKIRDFVREM